MKDLLLYGGIAAAVGAFLFLTPQGKEILRNIESWYYINIIGGEPHPRLPLDWKYAAESK